MPRSLFAGLIASAAILVTSVAAPPAASQSSDLYEGMVFPVQRSGWYSVINFQHDWGAPRMRLIDGVWGLVGRHEGNDIFAEPGTPVLAVLEGTVERVGWTFYGGWRVGIRGSDGRYWFYAHLQELPPLRVGQQVDAGRPIGKVGNTGYGPRPGHSGEFTYHLHLGIQEPSGVWVDPFPMLQKLYRSAQKAAA